jgi:hypothetical protein
MNIDRETLKKLLMCKSLKSNFSIERIRPPKREQVQFLFLSLGLHCIAGCMLQGPVNPTRGKKEADSSKIYTDSILTFPLMVHTAAVPQLYKSQDSEISTEPVPVSVGGSSLLRGSISA